MGDRISRRAVVALLGAGAVSSCSRLAYSVYMIADAEAVVRLREAVQAFASARDLVLVSVDGDPAILDQYARWSSLPFYFEYYRGRRSTLWFNRERSMAPGSFTVEFQQRHDVRFFGDNLEAWVQDFVAAISRVEGVRVPDGPA